MKIFLSYARRDKTYLQEVISHLDIYNLWWDKAIPGGEEWWTTIVQEIAISDCFIYLLSSKSIMSEHCIKEYNIAIEQGLEILPINIELGITLPSKELANIAHLQIVDFYDWKDTNQLRGLLHAVQLKERKVQNNELQTKSVEDLPIELVEPDNLPEVNDLDINGRLSNYWIHAQVHYSNKNTFRSYTKAIERYLSDMLLLNPDENTSREEFLSSLPTYTVSNSLSGRTFKEWIEKLLRDGRSTALRHAKPAIVGLAEMLVNDGFVSEENLNSIKVIKISKYQKKLKENKRRILSIEELSTLLRTAMNTGKTREQSLRNYLAISLALCTVKRREYLVNLSWNSIISDNNNQKKIIVHGKSNIVTVPAPASFLIKL